MKESMLIGLGAFIGAIARNSLSNWLQNLDPSFAWGTLVVNVIGSFLIGAFYTLIDDSLIGEYPFKHLVAIGFCGAFTTVSSYTWYTIALVRSNNYKLAVENFLLNNFLSLFAVVLGIVLVKLLYSTARGM